MKYQCTHCNHVFEQVEPEVKHCPKCFWTTSVAPFVDGASASSETVPAAEKSSVKLAARKPNLVITFVLILILIGIIAAVVFFILNRFEKPATSLNVQIKPAKRVQDNRLKETKPPMDPLASLTADEKTQLTTRFEMTLPRTPSQDEEEVLKKQVNISPEAGKKPVLAMWTKDDFKNFIKAQQARTKIPLGGSFLRKLYKLFDEHYLAAERFMQEGNFFMAREEFLKALAFPVYQNDVKMHRAVALVMLRGYINDVLGKIAAINQYLFSERLVTQADVIIKNYRSLFSTLDLKDWEESKKTIMAVQSQISNFEAEAKTTKIEFTPTLQKVDQEIQSAILKTTVPDPSKTIDFRGLLVDLDLKDKVVTQNMPGSISEAEKQYEQAFRLIELKDWQAAIQKLSEISFPPELVEDARRKADIVAKVIQAQDSVVTTATQTAAKNSKAKA